MWASCTLPWGPCHMGQSKEEPPEASGLLRSGRWRDGNDMRSEDSAGSGSGGHKLAVLLLFLWGPQGLGACPLRGDQASVLGASSVLAYGWWLPLCLVG